MKNEKQSKGEEILQPEQSPSRQIETSTKKPEIFTSTDLLQRIFKTLHSPKNHIVIDPRNKDETFDPIMRQKCNCRKSKCLKLYCECFAQGSFCKDCNCSCCQNTEQFSQMRAKAIDEVMIRAALPFGQKNWSIKGCNCKKTGCYKKYCECFRVGDKCSEYCKCEACINM